VGRPRKPPCGHLGCSPGHPGARGLAGQCRITSGRGGPPVSVYGHLGTPRDVPGSPWNAPDTGGSPQGLLRGPDKPPARLTKAGQPGRRRLPCKGCVHTS
jgi:hypothetical protein